VWRYMPVIPVCKKLRQEDCEFEASLDYMVRPCFKKKPKHQINKNTPKPNQTKIKMNITIF
jgi:hypothetical protein